ncbi:predicted protein [Histoplasma capsulatum H143]|uniref:Uncharacterized protein n=1 Tax=Ajellomyces capsulatus (strain H143) TaxID=544712 RepID=C6H749_AJECH|nr:predicted protein [Histoplasma capsulatum H143]
MTIITIHDQRTKQTNKSSSQGIFPETATDVSGRRPNYISQPPDCRSCANCLAARLRFAWRLCGIWTSSDFDPTNEPTNQRLNDGVLRLTTSTSSCVSCPLGPAMDASPPLLLLTSALLIR